tara:strand:- start:2247 stop:2936 length:690 start_codon:yes stop_codon:yes gene_type:complete
VYSELSITSGHRGYIKESLKRELKENDMSARSTTSSRILDAAEAHFAERGYDGSSLAEIAAAVGIKKASLYAHFANKDALFMDVFRKALAYEREAAARCFKHEPTENGPGSSYAEDLIKRYDSTQQLRFLLRTSYMPPEKLKVSIDEGHERYLDQLCEAFEARVRLWGASLSKATLQQYGQAYVGIIDSLQVKLVYTDCEQAAMRWAVMQQMLNAALQQAASQEVSHER